MCFFSVKGGRTSREKYFRIQYYCDKCTLEIKSPYTLLNLSYLESREAEIKNFLHEFRQTLFLLIGKNKFAIGHFGQ